MTRKPAHLPRVGPIWPAVLSLFVLGAAGRGIEAVYQRDDQDDFLRIERVPADGQPRLGTVTVDTVRGKRDVGETRGDCAFLFDALLITGHDEKGSLRSRLIVETTSRSYYRVLHEMDEDCSLTLATEVADKLHLEIAHERRPHLAYVIRRNREIPTDIERFRGRPKWPEARIHDKPAIGKDRLSIDTLYTDGGMVFTWWKDDGHGPFVDETPVYFDGVSLDQLAQYLEYALHLTRPVVNQSGDHRRYSFTLPPRFLTASTFTDLRPNQMLPLPGLGLSVTSDETETEVIVVRDKRPAGAADAPSSPLKYP
jgi:hypothetical protein